MWKKMAGRLFELQSRNGILEEKDRRLYEYAYGVLLGRVVIYLIIVILGIITGNWMEMIVFLLPFTVLRQYAGGIHLEKAGGCMAVSGILVLLCSLYLASGFLFHFQGESVICSRMLRLLLLEEQQKAVSGLIISRFQRLCRKIGRVFRMGNRLQTRSIMFWIRIWKIALTGYREHFILPEMALHRDI